MGTARNRKSGKALIADLIQYLVWGGMNYVGGMWILNQVQNDGTGVQKTIRDSHNDDVRNGGTRRSE